MIKLITITVGLTLLTGIISKPAGACDIIGPIAVDENGDHIVTYCFDAPTPEPPEGRQASGSGNEFPDFAAFQCALTGNLLATRSDGLSIRVCDLKQYRELQEAYSRRNR